MISEQRKREEEIERLARDAGRLIRDADPAMREELREAAAAIMREEAQETQATYEAAPRRPMNPMAAGLGLFVVGLALAFLMPFMGLALVAIGALAVIWGGIISVVRK